PREAAGKVAVLVALRRAATAVNSLVSSQTSGVSDGLLGLGGSRHGWGSLPAYRLSCLCCIHAVPGYTGSHPSLRSSVRRPLTQVAKAPLSCGEDGDARNHALKIPWSGCTTLPAGC